MTLCMRYQFISLKRAFSIIMSSVLTQEPEPFDFLSASLLTAILFWFFLLVSEPTADLPLTASSNNESSSRDMSSVEGNGRTEVEEAEVLNKPEIQGEKNTEPHSTPTENGSDHLVSPIGESQCYVPMIIHI